MYLDRRLWPFTAGFRARMAATVLLGLVSTILGVGRLALLGWLLGEIFAGAGFADLVWPFAAVAVVMLSRGLLEYARTMHAHRTSALVQLRLREQLYHQVVALGPGHFGLQRTGDVMLSIVDGVEQLETYFGQYLPQLVVALLTPLGIFAFVAILHLPVALVMLAFALLTLVAPAVFHHWDSRNSLARRAAYGAFGAEFLDAVQGLAMLKAFGQSAARARLLADKAQALFRATMWVLATNTLSRGITDTGIALGAAAAIALGAYRVADGAMELSVLLIVLLMGIEVYRPLRELRILLHQGMLGASAAEGILALLAATPAIRDERPAETARLEPRIEFRAVSFTYPGARAPAHDGLGIAIAPGQRVGIVGASGAGKSTVVRLLERLYDPDRGAVLIGGRDLRDIGLDRVRGQIAVVNQDTYLFHGSVEDNLRLGQPDASQDQLEAAARAANAHAFIERLPSGYRTVVGERGVRLSGGQRQRIAIARALLRDAPILVLDEALSAVDAENEAAIQQALDRLMRGRTTLIIAHRLSSVIDADRIFVLEAGRVVEAGRHQELMARGGVYARLMAEQADEEEAAHEPLLFTDGGDAEAAEAPIVHGAGSDAEPLDDILRAGTLGWGGAIRQLAAAVAPWRLRLGLTFILGVARVLAFVGVGILSALAILALKHGQPFDLIVIVLLVVAPVSGVLHWFESWTAHDMAFRLLAEMRIALFEKLDRLAPAYLLRRRSGDLVALATQDVEAVEYFFAHTVAPAFVAVLVPAAVMTTLLLFGSIMALALAPFLALIAFSPFLLRGRIDRLGSRAREGLGELNAHSVDTIQGLAEIVAFQEGERRGRAFVERIRHYHRTRLAFLSDLAAQTSLLEVATGMGGLAVVVAGAGRVADGALDAGVLPLLVLLAMAAFLPISEIANVGRQLADTLGATRRLHAVHSERVAVVDGPGVDGPDVDGPGVAGRGVDASPAVGAISLEVDGVSYAYRGTPRPAIHDVSFTLPAAATVALVGPSGAGKTTLAHLLMRFWDPDAGVVRMNGIDLKTYRLDQLRDRVALVAQDTYLFNDTLGANVLIARPTATDDEVREAIRRAALEETVAGFADGLETQVGERGVRLSGGQRQRVAIARAFLKDAPVLILDEATSHLDAVNERLVRNALASLMSERTTLVIAHRLSTVRNADLILVLDQGRLIESGTHEELVAGQGLYAQLVARQLAGRLVSAAQ